MINMDEINKTILDLENHDTTYATCERLAWLYIVRDHMTPQGDVSRETPYEGKSEFAQAINGKQMSLIIPILEEHMEVVKLLHPKEYRAMLDKIKEI